MTLISVNQIDFPQKMLNISEINFDPNDYTILNDKKGWRFTFIRYHFIIVKDGIILSKYIRQVK